MAGVDWSAVPDAREAGEEIHRLLAELYPIGRSLSGPGVRQTFELLQAVLPLSVTEVPSGSRVFDWTVPPEWSLREAWVEGPDGRRVLDARDCNLHVVGYSVPVRARMSLAELRPHLHTHPSRRDLIPFRTAYYGETWGFCLAQDVLDALPDGEYEVCVDSSLDPAGSIAYAECVVPGELADEVLVSTYSCHPSLANDNTSGIALVAVLGRYLGGMRLRRTHRLLFSPGTIGPLSWLAANEGRLARVRAGLVASCVGDPGRPTYKRSRGGDAEVDRAAAVVLRDRGDHELRDFAPLGGDERQFCSPGFDLPVGALSRTPADEFPEYHSSADDTAFVRPEFLGDSFHLYLRVIDALERNGRYENLNPKGEPQLGRRGLYRSLAGGSNREAALLWVLNLSDGSNDVLAVAERSGLPFDAVAAAADALVEVGLLRALP
jgi:aminopeptidase-like protein